VTQFEDQESSIPTSCIKTESLIVAKKLSAKKHSESPAKAESSALFLPASPTSAFQTAITKSAQEFVNSAGEKIKQEVKNFIWQKFGSETGLIAVVVSSTTSILGFLALCIVLAKKFSSKCKNACDSLDFFQSNAENADEICLVNAAEAQENSEVAANTPDERIDNSQAATSAISFENELYSSPIGGATST